MYNFPVEQSRGRNFLDPLQDDKIDISLSQYVKILCNVVPIQSEYPLLNNLKVVIAAGLTSSHPEQRS